MSHRRPSISVFILALGLLAAGAQAGETSHFDQQMGSILQNYQIIEGSLVGDAFGPAAVKAAQALALQAAALDLASVPAEHREHLASVPTKLKAAAELTQRATSIEAAREALKQLSEPMAMWAATSPQKDVSVMYCPMVKASWLQPGDAVQNPYGGDDMRNCGQKVSSDKKDMEGMKGMEGMHHEH